MTQLQDVHFSVVRYYLKVMGQTQGLLLNFGTPILEIKRVYINLRIPSVGESE